MDQTSPNTSPPKKVLPSPLLSAVAQFAPMEIDSQPTIRQQLHCQTTISLPDSQHRNCSCRGQRKATCLDEPIAVPSRSRQSLTRC